MRPIAYEVPIDPDADTARRWLEEELEKDVYRADGTSIIQKVLDWFNDLLSGFGDATGGASVGGVPGAVVTAVLFALLLGGLLYLVLGPLRRSRRTATSAAVFEDDDRTVEAMRLAAEAAAARGDWDLAVLERFRSIVRRAENDAVVAVVPGMTAFEFVGAAARRIEEAADDLLWAGDLFDGVRYGHASGSPQAYERLGRLETAVRSRPRVSAP